MSGETMQSENNSGVRFASFINARAREMEAMMAVIDGSNGQPLKKSGKNRAAQKVPIHMRRRAASHNLRRLPRQLRQKALLETKDAPPRVNKVPSRKHRRRPKNLIAMYNQRKQRKTWLETHIWHAKRFHMCEKWGYKLDISYTCCMELVGPQAKLIAGLDLLTSKEKGDSFGSLLCVNGSVEVKTCLYKRNLFPLYAIGTVSFHWKPVQELRDRTYPNQSQNRTLWIWIHPSIHQLVLDEIVSLFGLIKSNQSEFCINELNRNSPIYCKYPKITDVKFTNEAITLNLLKDALCRFKLRGPLSHIIAGDTLLAANVDVSESDSASNSPEGHEADPVSPWWKRVYRRIEAIRIHKQQTNLLSTIKNMASTNHLPSGCIVGLTVRDPRLFLPKKKTMIISAADKDTDTLVETQANTCTPRTPFSDTDSFRWPDVSASALYESWVRRDLKDTMLTDQKINQLRAENLIPGSLLKLGEQESRVPVLAIHCPAETLTGDTTNYGGGWDIIVPCGWGMPFLISMIYRGARVGGLTELQNSDFEMATLHFPAQYPDTEAGMVEEEGRRSALERKHKLKPPAKRVNHEKFGIKNPFHNPWSTLACEWGDSSKTNGTEFAVLRNVSKLQHLKSCLSGATELLCCVDRSEYLVPVKLEMMSAGCCETLSLICIPSDEDKGQLDRNPSYNGPVQHLKTSSQQNGEVRDDETIIELRHYCDRTLIGFVTEGRFSFKIGHGMGLGFVALLGLEALKDQANVVNGCLGVLVRSHKSCQYRFASLSILI